ncbi:TIGR02679 family protein [Xanthomonas cucurbitae]|uniref:TIGR02679 family protein n=1 Tax=Xanthomonas cucurbitae TaxID=56453 RepID=A0A2S7DG35_9XANT|nr:TIGR02679 family protein [Xanthomonas cucurbitae]PPU72783.1 TIGR02679 family protein [Xanthomonas cucurbitae]WDM78894.1 TIGR02679 family protein [Xanthomonas cucurbitae]WDM82576.1 TIGR02679 family protein [Xanthomonas cucurbitae]
MTKAAAIAPADPRLQRLLGGDELASVRQRLRRRYEQAGPEAVPGIIRLGGLDAAAYSALAQLAGLPSRRARSITLDVVELDARLRAAGLADSLRDALERLEGPIVAHARLRNALQSRWSALLIDIQVAKLLRDWLDQSPAALTLLKRLAREPDRADLMLQAADNVLARLPASGVPRSQLSAELLGDAHALDPGRPVATIVLTAWRWYEGTRDAGRPGTAGDPDDARVRHVWARAGVLVSALARPALYLNLPMPGQDDFTRRSGEPGYLSLRQLLRHRPAWPVAGRRIHVCENPDIVAIAADRLGAACAPLICTDGMPAAAQRILLDQLTAAGAHLHYHGDYDWPGIGIANLVMRTWNARPWRFGTADYRAAVAQAPTRPHELSGDSVQALWDAELTMAMASHGVSIAEEAVVASLLVDLQGTR